MRVASVAPFIRLPRGLSFFDYEVPPALLIRVGSVVRIPFRAAQTFGVVIAVREKKRVRRDTKKITAVLTHIPQFPQYAPALVHILSRAIAAPPALLFRLFFPVLPIKSPSFRLTDMQSAVRRYRELSIRRSALPMLYTLTKQRQPVLFIWQKNDERIIAYIKLIETHLPQGSVLLLFSQWSDVESFVSYLPTRFAHTIACVTSALPQKKFFALWRAIAQGEKRIVIGTRQALFAPFVKLSCIIVDGENNYGWKEEQNPRYDARHVAGLLAKITGASLCFSSPAPTIERRYALRSTTITTPPLPSPQTIVANLRESFTGEHPYITETLRAHIAQLRPHDRIVIFLNRKGFAGSVLCDDCGAVIRCPSCTLPLTHHKENERDTLLCHHCLRVNAFPLACPRCNGTHLSSQGKGLEHIEAIVRKFFSSFTAIEFLTYQAMHALFWESGTRDFHAPKLIAIIDALAPLAMADFSANDECFAYITMVRKLAAASGATLILQAMEPEHPLLTATNMTQRELEERKKMRYPPYTRLIKFIVKDINAENAQKRCEALASLLTPSPDEALASLLTPSPDKERAGVRFVISAPFPAHPPKRGRYYYWYRLLRVDPKKSLAPIIKKIPNDILIDADPETLL